jgi:hypothetical protein
MTLNQWEATSDFSSHYYVKLGASYIARAFESPIFDDEDMQSNFFVGNFAWVPSPTSVTLMQVLPVGFVGDMVGSSLPIKEEWALFARFIETVAQVTYHTHY